MKQIPMHELKLGDVWTHEIKIKNREVLEVVEKTLTTVIVVSRNDEGLHRKHITKPIKGKVFYLRNTQKS